MFRISIPGKGYDTEALHLDGLSGVVYPFLWDKAVGRYCYTPKSQNECDDIFGTMNPNSFYFFSVVAEGELPLATEPAAEAGLATNHPAATLERKYYQDLEEDELAALAKDCGIERGIRSTCDPSIPEDDRRRETWRLILDAYYLGAGWKAVQPPVREELASETPPAQAAPAAVIDMPQNRPARAKPAAPKGQWGGKRVKGAGKGRSRPTKASKEPQLAATG